MEFQSRYALQVYLPVRHEWNMVNNFLQLVPEQLRDVLVCVCENPKQIWLRNIQNKEENTQKPTVDS